MKFLIFLIISWQFALINNCKTSKSSLNSINNLNNNNNNNGNNENLDDENNDINIKTNVKCSVEHSINSIDTCNSIKSSYRLTDIRFQQLNPEINCNHLILGEKVCANDQNFGCLNYTVLPNGHNESCEKLAAKFSMSVLTFRSINNWLDCDLVKNLNTFCFSKFSPACSEIYQVKSNDTFLSLVEKINSTELFHKANPFLDPANLKEGQIICLKEKKNDMEIHLTDLKTNEFSKVLSSFGNIKTKLDGYLVAPSKQKSDEMQNEILETMSVNSDFRKSIKLFEEKYASEELEKNGLNNLCEVVQFDEDFPLTKACACDNIEPKSYCGILFIQETENESKRIQIEPQKSQNVSAESRKMFKRSIFEFIIGSDDLCLSSPDLCLPNYILTTCITGELCTPKINEFFNPHEYFGALEISVCITILKKLNGIVLLKNLGLWDGCLAKLSATFFPFRGSIHFDLDVNTKLLLKIEGNSFIQLYKPNPECEGSCLDYFNDRKYCYAKPDFVSANLEIFVGFELLFFKNWKKIYEFSEENPDCNEDNIKTSLTSTTATSSSTKTTTTSSTTSTTTISSTTSTTTISSTTSTTTISSTTSTTTISSTTSTTTISSTTSTTTISSTTSTTTTSSTTSTTNTPSTTSTTTISSTTSTTTTSSTTSTTTTSSTTSTTSVPIKPCLSNPCLNGGTCLEKELNSYECLCPFTHTNLNCETLAKWTYVIKVETSYSIFRDLLNSKGSGTEAVVSLNIYGKTRNETNVFLIPDDNVFDAGEIDSFTFSFKNFGEILYIKIGHDNTGENPDWYLESITIEVVENKKEYFFSIESEVEQNGQNFLFVYPE